jgi:hypothetical protein
MGGFLADNGRVSKEIAEDVAAIRAWKARWTAVNEFQDAELRNLSLEERFDQLGDLYELALALDPDGALDQGEAASVRESWSRLRRVLRDRT